MQRSRVSGNSLASIEDPANAAVTVEDPILHGVGTSFPNGLLERLGKGAHVVGVHDADVGPSPLHEIGGRVAGKPVDRISDKEHVERRQCLTTIHDARKVRDHRPETDFALSKFRRPLK